MTRDDQGTRLLNERDRDVLPTCPRCGSPSYLLVMARDRERSGAEPGEVRRCAGPRCGVGFTRDPGEHVAAAPSLAGQGALDRLASAIVAADLRQLRGPGPGARLLDVGAGCGLRARVAAGMGFEVTALEPDPAEAERARRRLSGHGRVVQRTLEGADRLGRFDVVMAWHVLEHLRDPDAALAAMGRRLVPGGVLVVAMPNGASAEARVLGGRWHGWEPSRHRWHLDRRSLRRLLDEAGLDEVSVEVTGGWRYPASLAYSLAPAVDPQVARGPRWRGPALAAVLVPVAALLAGAGLGPQLVATARAPAA